MRRRQIRQCEMLARVRNFGADYGSRFPAASVAGRLFTTIGAAVDEANVDGAAHVGAHNRTRAQSAAKAAAGDTLRRLMLALCRTARAMTPDAPGIDLKMRMPQTRTDQELIAVAGAMVQQAAPYADHFVAHGLSSTFLADLAGAAGAFDTAIRERAAATGARAAAVAKATDAIANGFAAAKRLDAVMKNLLASDPGLLAAWNSARHVSKLGLTYPPADDPVQQPLLKVAA